MRHGRAKSARKTLKFYSINGNIKPPYKIILDGNFLAASIKSNLPLQERLQKLLQNEAFQLYTTRSALEELNALPGEVFQKARQFGLDECEIIERGDIPSFSQTDVSDRKDDHSNNPNLDICSLVMNGNGNGWFVATQDEDLSDKIRGFVNVPQIRLARSVLILEAPSSASRRDVQYKEKGKQLTGGGTMTKDEKELIQKFKDAEKKSKQANNKTVVADSHGHLRRKRKAKEPNPLSCKKKKNADDVAKPEKKKRIRKRKKSSNDGES